MNSREGRFVCLEGIDGAGKTTAVGALGALLREHGIPVAVVDKHTVTFASDYVATQMRALHDMIWGHPGDDPYLQLGDWHWIHLQAAWYAAMSRCVVEPLLAAGTLVLTDTWTYKFLAKLAMRPLVDFGQAQAAFAGVATPDLVVRFVIDPAVAAARKVSFGISESGNHEGAVERTAQGFIDYQTKVSMVLDDLGTSGGWARIDVNALSVDTTVATLIGILAQRVPELMTANR